MTLIMALRCSDGLLMASDSQGTETAGGANPFAQVKFEVNKIHRLTTRSVVACAGSMQISREVAKAAQAEKDLLEASPDVAESLVSLVRPILDRHYKAHLSVASHPSAPPFTETLACGLTSEGMPWIREISIHCHMSDYEQRGFHAIGSGAPFAQLANALVSHFNVVDRPLEQGKVVAYRVMDIAINTSAHGVDEPIRMWQITADGAEPISEDEMEAIKTSVGGWQEHEKSSLDDVFNVNDEDVASLDEELPADDTPTPKESGS